MTEITFSLDKSSINDAIKQLKAYERKINSNLETAVRNITDEGAEVAKSSYSRVPELIATEENPGDQFMIFADFTQDEKRHIDVGTQTAGRDKQARYVIAKGSGVGFAEFGAGVYSDPGHPLVGAAPFPVYPASWSEQDKQQFYRYGHWWFSNIIYYGIAPARGLYNASKRMTEIAKDAVKEAFERGGRP